MTIPEQEIREALAPVLLEFGTTVFHCQMFEDNLCFLLALVSEHTSPSDGQAFQASWDFHSQKTLGGLASALSSLIDVPSRFEESLRSAVKQRNKIVHGYLTRSMLRLLEPKGRLEIIDELVALRGQIDSQDYATEQLILTVLEKFGVRSPELQIAAERYWRMANASPTTNAGRPH